jgi:allantoicase
MTDTRHLVDLASSRLGAAIVAANDEFFAPKENLLKPDAPVFIADKYTDRGKWMDGWETRRRRTPGHDWALIRLGLPGVIRTVIVDTSHFRGNYPSHCSIDACVASAAAGEASLAGGSTPWRVVLDRSELRGDAPNTFTIEDHRRYTHVRLNIHPDGGVARLRVFGEAVPEWRALLAAATEIDLASIAQGAHVVDCSDRFFGEPRNMLMPYPALNMGDGWETKRRRGPGHDWTIVRLGVEGEIRRIEVDTAFFKGNYPESCSIEATVIEEREGGVSADAAAAVAPWRTTLERTALQPDHLHVFERELAGGVVATHVRFNIFPDGGVSRFRVFGRPTSGGRRYAAVVQLNAMTDDEAAGAFADCCGAPAWVERMTAARPFRTVEEVFAASDAAFHAFTREDWLEAFRHHPRLGERHAERSQSDLSQAWAAEEQSGVHGEAADAAALADANRAYEQRFGYGFITFASGKSLGQILAELRGRFAHEPAAELKIAAGELRRITRLRLDKLLAA